MHEQRTGTRTTFCKITTLQCWRGAQNFYSVIYHVLQGPKRISDDFNYNQGLQEYCYRHDHDRSQQSNKAVVVTAIFSFLFMILFAIYSFMVSAIQYFSFLICFNHYFIHILCMYFAGVTLCYYIYVIHICCSFK